VTTTWLFEALPTDKGTPQCRVTFASRVDIKSSVPTFVMNYLSSNYAKSIIDIRNKFAKTDDEKDSIARELLAKVIKNEQQTYTEEEERAIRSAKEFYKKCKEGTGSREFRSPDFKVEMRGSHDGDSQPFAIATTTVDASVYECAAHAIVDLNSRYAIKTLKQYGIVDFTVKNINNHSLYYFSTKDLGIPGFAYRDFRTKITWKRENLDGRDVVWINFQSTDDLTKEYPIKFGHIVGTSHTIWMFESLSPLGGVPQTRVTLQTQVDFHSPIPYAVIEKLGTKFLSNASRLRKDFDKTNEIDKPRRMEIVKKMKDLKVRGDTKLLPLFDMIRATVGAEGGGKSWGMISVTVRTGFEEAAAYLWDVDRLPTKGLVRESAKAGNDFDLEVKAKECIKTTLQSFNVAFVSKMRLYRADKSTLVIMSEAIKERGLQSLAREDFAVRFCRVGKKETKINIVTRLELGNEITKAAAKNSAKRRCSVGVNAAIYFDNLLSSSEANEEDGRRFGDQLMSRVKDMPVGGSKDEVVVKEFMARNRAMKEIEKHNRFVKTMLCAIVRNKLRRRATHEGEVGSLEEARGLEIGSALKMITVQTATAKHAVDEWAHQYTEVQEVMREYKWFRPMIETIAVNLFKNSKIGLKARVTFGAVTSMSDLLTDVYVTYMFLSDEKYGYFKASLASLVMSIGLQMLTVWFQNRKLGMTKVLREWFPILIGYKPAVDAYRVATGAKQEIGGAVDPMIEMTCMKVLEMFCEAIPGVIIQLTAIATSEKDVGTSAWLSVAVSAITTGFASATISYDTDTNPAKREEAPASYGYIPANASKRTIVFVSMLLFTAGMLLLRCTTIVLLGLMGGSWAFLYIGADLGLFLLVKILSGDFWFWLPLGGNMEIVSSILFRVILKIIVDFTSLVHFRLPNEVGGAYWLFGLLLTMVSPSVSIFVASPYVDDNAIDIASSIVNHVIPITTMRLAVFFYNIERKYWQTFWSTQRSKDMSMAYFLEGKSDKMKFEVFTNSRHHWVSIEGEIKKWVEENWAKWEEEQQVWFTDVRKAKVPVEFIPQDGNARRKESVRRASVDAEAEGGLAGTLRASFRRASVGGADGGDIIGMGSRIAKVSSVVPLEDEVGSD
jgi:hypothetical protein